MTQQRDVGLIWINLGTFPYGVKLKWLQGSFVWWRITPQHLYQLYHTSIYYYND